MEVFMSIPTKEIKNDQVKANALNNDPFEIDVRELKSSALHKEAVPEVGTTITVTTAVSVIKYTIVWKC